MKQIAVIGSGEQLSSETYDIAYTIGKLIALSGNILVCGGHGGVMEAASKGAIENNGITVGILHSYNKSTANPYIDIKIATGMNHGRNVIVAASADAVIAIEGGTGTLAEIAYAARLGIKIIGIRTWKAVSPEYGKIEIIEVNTAEEAVLKATE
jgi:uncharacterized protein (TIGR00725 family)